MPRRMGRERHSDREEPVDECGKLLGRRPYSGAIRRRQLRKSIFTINGCTLSLFVELLPKTFHSGAKVETDQASTPA